MSGFALVWSKMLDSSIWINESKETRLVWVTLLMMKDFNGIVQASVVGLADRAKVSKEECQTALKIFLSPDPDDTSKVEEGRRIREVPGGWEIVNHDHYRFSTEAKREFWRLEKEKQREKKKKLEEAKARKKNKNNGGASGPLGGEGTAIAVSEKTGQEIVQPNEHAKGEAYDLEAARIAAIGARKYEGESDGGIQ